MTQDEVMKILKEKKRKMSAGEISNILNKSTSTINTNLRKLREEGVVKCDIPRNRDFGIKSYLYYLKND